MTLEITGLTCGYGDITVVRNLSLNAVEGQVLALLGRNGAGKTTTLKAVAGLITADAGRISVRGSDVTAMPPYRRVSRGLAFVQEGKRIFRQRTVEENLILGAYSARANRRQLQDRMEEAYGRFPILRERRGLAAGALSGGQQQMLTIAQALMREPTVLMLDEPSAGLAPAVVGEVYEVIARLRDEGLTVLLVEQAVGWASAVADRIAVLELGHKVYEGPPTGAEADRAIRRIELGGGDRAFVPDR